MQIVRICGPNRQLPRGIGNGASNCFGGPWYTEVELETLRDRSKAIGTGGSWAWCETWTVRELTRRRLSQKGRVAYHVDNHESGDVIVAVEPAEQVEDPQERIPPRPSVEGVWGCDLWRRVFRADSRTHIDTGRSGRCRSGRFGSAGGRMSMHEA